MAKRIKELPFRALVERFTSELSAAIQQQVDTQVSAMLARIQHLGGAPTARTTTGSGKADGRRSGRLCPVPGCGKPGAGPRNRWFCRDHVKKLSATEQKGILERNRRLAAEGKLPTQVPAQRIVRLPAKQPRARRTLDMSCRVEACPNRSRGPRAGFICDQHRAELSPDEQRQARERWNARHKGQVVSAVAEAPPKAATAVPPIVRKAETTVAEG
jgi:hypothetical protein